MRRLSCGWLAIWLARTKGMILVKPVDKKVARAKKRSDGRKALLVYLDQELIKNLKVAAVERDTTASAITSEAIESWLRARGFLNRRQPE